MANFLEVGGTDYISHLEADTLRIEQTAGEFAAVCSFRLKEVGAASIDIVSRDPVKIKDANGTLFRGEVIDTDWDPMAIGQSGRAMTVHCNDYNPLLEETVIVGGTEYVAYSDAEVLNRLFGAYRSDINATTYVSELRASMSVAFANQTLLDAVQTVADQTGGRWYVDYDKNLHYFSAESNTAAWFLSDYPGGGSAFPYQNVSRRLNGKDIVNQVLVVGENVTSFVEDAASVAAYGVRQAVVEDNQITTVGSADARGTAILSKYAQPQVLYNVTTRKTGLRAGMDVRLRVQDWGVDETLTVRRLTIGWSGQSQLRSYDLELGDGAARALTGGGDWRAPIRDVDRAIRSIDDKVFDTDSPSTPTFTSGNLSTGVRTQGDGTELVWIAMTWGSVSDTDLHHYEAQLSLQSDFSSEVMTRIHPGDGDRIEIWEGLVGGSTYYARIRSVDWAGNASSWSGTQNIAAAADTSAPATPTGVTAIATPSSVHVNWNANSESDLAGYGVQRKLDGGSYSTIAALHQSTLLVDHNVAAGSAYWYQVRATDRSGNNSNYAEIASSVTPAAIPSGYFTTSIMGWSHDLVFSASDSDTVAWASGTIHMADGTTTYSITGSNTGNMTAVTYIYLDTDVSTTALQTSTNAASAVGDNRILVAVAQNETGGKNALFQVFGGDVSAGVLITADNIAANTITANEIAANTITSGEIQTGSIIVGDLHTDAQARLFDSSAASDNVQAWAHGSDATKIDGGDIYTNTVTATQIAALTIGADQIASNAITAIKINAEAVEADKIKAGAVTTAKLDAGAVTVEKLDVVVGGYNILINSGMNDDDDGDGAPDEWTAGSAGSPANVIISLDPTDKIVGASSFKVAWYSGDDNGDSTYIYQVTTLADVPLAVGDDFVLSGYIKASGLSNVQIELYVRWYDSGAGVLQTNYAAQLTANQAWTRHTISNTVPAGAVTARVYCLVVLTDDSGTGGIWFDAIKLERGDVPTAWTTGMIGNVTIDSNRVQVQDSNAKVWLGKRGSSLGMWGEDTAGNLQVGWYASGANAGGIVAGAGVVVLDASGLAIELTTSEANLRAFQFVNSSDTVLSSVRGHDAAAAHSIKVGINSQAAKDSFAYVSADAPDGKTSHVKLHLYHGGLERGYVDLKSGTVAASDIAYLDVKANEFYFRKVTGQVKMFIGETANANMAAGLTINQQDADDEILALKSSDISHDGYSTETDTFGLAKKLEGAYGGLQVRGFKESGGTLNTGLMLEGFLNDAMNTDKTTAAEALIMVRGFRTSAGALADATENGNVFSVSTRRGGSIETVVIIDEDGDIYHDGTTTAYDEYDDALMAGDLGRVMSGQYDELIEHNREAFEAAGIIGPRDENGRFMVSTKGVTALTLGALGQLWERCQRYERALARIDPSLLEEGT